MAGERCFVAPTPLGAGSTHAGVGCFQEGWAETQPLHEAFPHFRPLQSGILNPVPAKFPLLFEPTSGIYAEKSQYGTGIS
jgi:hypothetical protein